MEVQNNKPTWIWYPGDFEVALHSEVCLRREERGRIMPPFWRMDTFYHSVRFRRKVNLSEPELVEIAAEGNYTVLLDYVPLYDEKGTFVIPQGAHELEVAVINRLNAPALFIRGKSVFTDGSWEVSSSNQRWIGAGSWCFYKIEEPPSEFKLETKEIKPIAIEKYRETITADFGKEVMGFVKLTGIKGKGIVSLYYGESLDEALSEEYCETLDSIHIDEKVNDSLILPSSRAFRFVRLVAEPGLIINEVSLLFEFLPLKKRGDFRSSNQELNKIWNTAIYTLQLNTREFFLDGIKRDRWVWSGDAYQSFLMNYYSFFDEAVVRRTLVALRGKDPVESHINGIMDYTFYWMIALYDYYMYTGDAKFIRDNYSRILSMMEFCQKRTNPAGMMEGKEDDWIFIDWADMDKTGEVSTEQLLYARSLEVMSIFSQLAGDADNSAEYKKRAERLRKDILEVFWSENAGGLVNNRLEDRVSENVTRYPNIFAVLFNYLKQEHMARINSCVLQNRDIQNIKTPYMRFYELAALCEAGEQNQVLKEIAYYWGGMLELGATTFWEEYDPNMTGKAHYAMYGRPFGKSLCHAWGASPIYLLGRYFLGIRPDSPGFETYTARPCLGGLKWMEGSVPVPGGKIDIFMDEKLIRIKSSKGNGRLIYQSHNQPGTGCPDIEIIGEGLYGLAIQAGCEYKINYEKNLIL